MLSNKKMRCVLQHESNECGLACIAMLANYFGNMISLRELRAISAMSMHGFTLKGLCNTLGSIGFNCKVLSLELDEIKYLKLPCIIHWCMSHYVILNRVFAGYYEVYDPALGIRRYRKNELNGSFTGIAIEATPSASFEKNNNNKIISSFNIYKAFLPFKRTAIQAVILAILIEIIALIAPQINRIIIDDVLVNSDSSLLLIVIISLILLTALESLIALSKGMVITNLSVLMNYEWLSAIFCKILSLETKWFERRSLGDICAKFDAINSIESIISNLVVSLSVNVIVLFGVFFILIFYSPWMAIVGIVTILVYGLIMLTTVGYSIVAKDLSWKATTNEVSFFMQVIRGIKTIRVNNFSERAHSEWMRLNSVRRNCQMREQRINVFFSFFQTINATLSSAIVIWIGATLVLNEEFSIGLFVTCLAYHNTFCSSGCSIINGIFSFKNMSVHLDKLEDIVGEDSVINFFSNDEKNVYKVMPSMSGDIVCRFDNVTYSYDSHSGSVVNELSFCVTGNEKVALYGPSGKGKSTVISLLTGLYFPDKGNVELFGVDSRSVNYKNIYNHVGVVLQSDFIFDGTIVDNITLLDADIRQDDILDVAIKTGLHDIIQHYPMGYLTNLNDNGSTLSGGQRQRLLLARALYKKPKLLILDEATSHLDADSEDILSFLLKDVDIPAIIISHRDNISQYVNRVVHL